MLRRKRRQLPADAPPAGIDVTTLEPSWRAAVEETLASRRRLQELAGQLAAGPLQERLASVSERVDAGVVAAWRIASQAQAASRMMSSLDVDAVQARLKDARRRLADARATSVDTAALETEVQLLADQHSSLHQLHNTIDDAADQLRLLDLRLDAAVARAAQIALGRNPVDDMSGVERELATVVEELEALRAGLDAVGTLGP